MTKTHEEYLDKYLASQPVEMIEGTTVHQPSFNVTYPSSLDWRMKGFVTEVGTKRCKISC